MWTENPVGVLRTSDSVPDRGGSLQSGYDHALSERADPHPAAGITEAELWENLEYFLDEVVPVAEEATRSDAMPGYTDMGRLFAIGYMKGLLDCGA